MGLVAPRHVGSSRARARTRVPCIDRQILSHCTTREALSLSSWLRPLSPQNRKPKIVISQLHVPASTVSFPKATLHKALRFVILTTVLIPYGPHWKPSWEYSYLLSGNWAPYLTAQCLCDPIFKACAHVKQVTCQFQNSPWSFFLWIYAFVLPFSISGIISSTSIFHLVKFSSAFNIQIKQPPYSPWSRGVVGSRWGADQEKIRRQLGDILGGTWDLRPI